jgi:hypothetical protein
MATVQVEVELSDIDFDDLLEEVIERIDSEHPYSKREKEFVNKLKIELRLSEAVSTGDNLSDQMKMEFLMEMRDKYSEDQLRSMEEIYIKNR